MREAAPIPAETLANHTDDKSEQPGDGAENAIEAPGESKKSDSKPAEAKLDAKLQFAFEGTPWRTVLDWLADEASLSLYVGALPAGSLTYADTRTYTPDEAIERINRFLIPLGYTLIRSGKMISVIGLEDTRRDQLLDALAEYCELGELDKRGDHEVVKCMFTLAKADPQETLVEIQSLVKLSRPVLMELQTIHVQPSGTRGAKGDAHSYSFASVSAACSPLRMQCGMPTPSRAFPAR